MKKLLFILAILLFPLVTHGATVNTFMGNIYPVDTLTYEMGTTTSFGGKVREWLKIFSKYGYFSHCIGIGLATSCEGMLDAEHNITVTDPVDQNLSNDPGLASAFVGTEDVVYIVYSYQQVGSQKIFSPVGFTGDTWFPNAGESVLVSWTAVPFAHGYRVCRSLNGGALEYIDVSPGVSFEDRDNLGAPFWATGCSVTPTSLDMNSHVNYDDGSVHWGLHTSDSLFAGDLARIGGTATTSTLYKLLLGGSAWIDGLARASYFVATSSTPSVFPNASTTNLSSEMSTTSTLYGAKLSSCNGASNALTWANGQFGCNSIATTGTLDGVGFAGMMTSWVDGDTLRATSTLIGANLIATSSSATSTFAGGLTIGTGFTYQAATATTTITNLNAGSLVFDDNPGVVTALDASITSACANNTVQSYSFTFDASTTPNMTVYGECDGSGNIKNQRIGIGTTTPTARFTVGNFGDVATTTIFFDSVATKGTCLVMKDITGTGYTYITTNAGVLTASTISCR